MGLEVVVGEGLDGEDGEDGSLWVPRDNGRGEWLLCVLNERKGT